MPVVSMKDLLEAGVHFGHQTRRWNPKMKPYIFTERNGIYILDLQRSLREIDTAYKFVRSIAGKGRAVLFVGTKKQAQEAVANEAGRSGMPYVNERWLGGMLTNFVTIRKRVSRMVSLELMESDGTMDTLPKKEALKLRGELEKLNRNLNGIRDMSDLPGAIFVIDTKREAIAMAEARRLKIPIVGLVDTNADPDEADYVVPGNDDAIRAVNLITRVIADACVEGRAAFAPMEEKVSPAEPVKAVAAEPVGAAPEPVMEAVMPDPEPTAEIESETAEALAPEVEEPITPDAAEPVAEAQAPADEAASDVEAEPAAPQD